MKDNTVQPPESVLEAFAVSGVAVKLEGGQGSTYRVGDTVLKPAFGVEEAEWVADVYATIKQTGFRVPLPLVSSAGRWVFEGWTAWEYLEGSTLLGERYDERISASQAFHKALADCPRPAFLDDRDDPWSQADRIVWENAEWQPHQRVAEVYEHLQSCVRPLTLHQQIIHGDISGNMLYKAGEPLAVIDFSPYWRPAAYAEALFCVDAVLWERAPWSLVTPTPTFLQLTVRAALRRLVEVERHYRLRHLPETHLDQVRRYSVFASRLSTLVKAG